MKIEKFQTVLFDNIRKKWITKEVEGPVSGDYGTYCHDFDKLWYVVHIPTGLSVISSPFPQMRQARLIVKRLSDNMPKIEIPPMCAKKIRDLVWGIYNIKEGLENESWWSNGF